MTLILKHHRSAGIRTTGVLAINGSSSFEIVRTKIYAGNAADGTAGVTPGGAGGAGGGGNGGGGGKWKQHALQRWWW
jgi:hypothetical protein